MIRIFEDDILIEEINSKYDKKTKKLNLKSYTNYKFELSFNKINNCLNDDLFNNLNKLEISFLKTINFNKKKSIEILDNQLFEYNNYYFLKLKVNFKTRNDYINIDKLKYKTDFPDSNKNFGFSKGISVIEEDIEKITPELMAKIIDNESEIDIRFCKSGVYNIIYNLGNLNKEKISYISFLSKDNDILEEDIAFDI